MIKKIVCSTLAVILVTMISLLFVKNYSAKTVDELVVNKTDYNVLVGEYIEIYVQGKNKDRTFDVDKPVIQGDKSKGYKMIGDRKILFTEEGNYIFHIMFEGIIKEIAVSVSNGNVTKPCKILTVDGEYRNNLLYKTSEGEYEIVEYTVKGYSIPLDDGDVFLTKNKSITKLLTISDGKVTSGDESIEIEGDVIKLLASLEELI